MNDPWLNRFLRRVRLAAPEIRLDVEETNESYLLRADLPGVAKDQIQVEIDQDVVKITVEYKRESAGDAKALRIERASGSATRSIRLPAAVDAAKAEAKHVDGDVQLRCPSKRRSPSA